MPGTRVRKLKNRAAEAPGLASEEPAARRPRWPPTLLVAALTLAVFWPVLGNQFVNWDDDQNFLANPGCRGLGPSNLRWMFTTFHLGHYHPLTWLSLGLDYAIWGLDPAGYRLTSLLLHTANAVLFYLLALRLLGGKVRAAAPAALLFAAHPLRVESVAWASERRDALSGPFYLLALPADWRAERQGPRRRWPAASLLAFGAALLSKVIVVSLPVVLLVLDIYPLRRLGGARRWFSVEARRVWAEKIPYAALAAGAVWAALALQKTGVSGFAGHVAVLPVRRIGLSLYGLAFYLWKTVFPFNLYPQYVLATDISPFDGRILAAAAVVAALTVALLRRRFPAGLAV